MTNKKNLWVREARLDTRGEIAAIVRNGYVPARLAEQLALYSPEDIAAALPLLENEARRRLCCALSAGELAAVLARAENGAACFRLLSDRQKREVLGRMEVAAAARLLHKQSDSSRLLHQLPEEQRSLLLALTSPTAEPGAAAIQGFSPEQLGSRMSQNFIAVPKNAAIKEAMSQLVCQAAEHDNISTLYLVDKNGVFCGAVDLKDLIVARAETPLAQITTHTYPYLYAAAEVEDCLPYLMEHTEASIPVLDERNRLLGVVTAHDFAEMLDAELGEDYARLGGLSGEEDLAEPVGQSLEKRLPWLCVLLVLGLGVSAAVGMFESVVARLPVILCFQSLILDMAGNVGTQSLAVAIRVLMASGLDRRRKAALVWKEARVGLLGGYLLGLLSCGVVGAYLCLSGQAPGFAFAVAGCLGAAMVLAMAVSALSGTLVPLFFQRIGIDPAVASGPLITTLNDLVAVVAYYGLAWLILIEGLCLV